MFNNRYLLLHTIIEHIKYSYTSRDYIDSSKSVDLDLLDVAILCNINAHFMVYIAMDG